MNGGRTTATVLTALTLVALPLAGCGKEKPKIPRSDARSLVALLETVKRQTDAHACTTVERTIASLERRTEALPSNTDGDVRSSLRDGIANLRELVRSDCFPSQKKPKTESTDTTTSEPDTSTDTTSDTNTDTTTDTTTETTPPDTNTNTDTTPPDNGNTDTTPSGGVGPPGQQKKNGGKK